MNYLKSTTLLFSALALVSSAQAATTTKTDSVYTDVNKDCIVVSSATKLAPIDFYETECKAFGGYRLGEFGSDLRYGPRLSYNGVTINLQRPMSFHQMGSTMIEWVFDLKTDEEGGGELVWKALIFRMNSDDFGSSAPNAQISNLHVVRLNGEKSCIIGKVKTNVEARALANNATAACMAENE